MTAHSSTACHCEASDNRLGTAIVQNYYLCPCQGGQPVPAPAAPGPPPDRKGVGRFGSFIVTVVAGALAALIAAGVLVLFGYLGAHYPHAGHPLVHQAGLAIMAGARR